MVGYHTYFVEILNFLFRKMFLVNKLQLKSQKQEVLEPYLSFSDNQDFDDGAPDPLPRSEGDIDDEMISDANPSIGRWS